MKLVHRQPLAAPRVGLDDEVVAIAPDHEVEQILPCGVSNAPGRFGRVERDDIGGDQVMQKGLFSAPLTLMSAIVRKNTVGMGTCRVAISLTEVCRRSGSQASVAGGEELPFSSSGVMPRR